MAFDFLRNLVSRRSEEKQEYAQIFVLLRRALEARCMLSVRVGTDPETYLSAILEVVRDGRYLVLDELNPKSGHASMEANREVEIRAVVEGIVLRFRSYVMQVAHDNGLPYYKIAFPKTFTYAQKRDQYRVAVPLHQHYEVRVMFADGREIAGELRDLSMGGLSARLHAGRIDPVADMKAVATFRLVVSRELSFAADAEIRNISAAQPPRVPRVGARFVALNARTSRRIEEFCDEIQTRRLRGSN